MTFLRHESARLRFGTSSLNLVGVDYEMKGPYLSGVEQLVDLDSFNLLLAHTPEVFPTAADKGFDLTLSGHTHGGQINLPLFGANINVADARTPYTKGLYTLPTSKIYVNSGLGTIGVPVRLGAPPEITLIRLCAS
jgi:predicted MPP superfamily phosphohydrolase